MLKWKGRVRRESGEGEERGKEEGRRGLRGRGIRIRGRWVIGEKEGEGGN